MLMTYDVHVPDTVIGEITVAAQSDDLLAAAANLVLKASDNISIHDVSSKIKGSTPTALDTGEFHCIWLANNSACELFVTDEMNNVNILLIQEALDDQNLLTTTPKLLCKLAEQGILDPRHVSALLTYYAETKNWDQAYLSVLRNKHL